MFCFVFQTYHVSFPSDSIVFSDVTIQTSASDLKQNQPMAVVSVTYKLGGKYHVCLLFCFVCLFIHSFVHSYVPSFAVCLFVCLFVFFLFIYLFTKVSWKYSATEGIEMHVYEEVDTC